ncbi:hypothetical protein ACUXZZ_45355 (plasmid) [Streptomyces graminifolii]|uniref:hypothetical protein n=1 Tax=Streptomyces graminifolii TaxID=1266771 RepID=UPI00405A4265
MSTDNDNDRDWGVIAVTTTLLGTSGGRAVSEEIAAEADHLVVVSRERGGEWQPITDPERPARYAYLVDGVLTAGTLVDYAQAWKVQLPEVGHVSPDVRTWEGARFDVTVERLGVVKGWMRYRLSVGAETVDVSFDGRA